MSYDALSHPESYPRRCSMPPPDALLLTELALIAGLQRDLRQWSTLEFHGANWQLIRQHDMGLQVARTLPRLALLQPECPVYSFVSPPLHLSTHKIG